jgi:nicotinamide mononucleotide adenylyltransferase
MTGIIIGRFQVPHLHPGHLMLIATALRECKKVVIFLGCSTVTDNEKYVYKTRYTRRMITDIFPQIDIFSLYDYDDDDKVWSESVDNYCDEFMDPVLYHSRDSFRDRYTGKYPIKEVEEVPGYSGTQLRESLNKKE